MKQDTTQENDCIYYICVECYMIIVLKDFFKQNNFNNINGEFYNM